MFFWPQGWPSTPGQKPPGPDLRQRGRALAEDPPREGSGLPDLKIQDFGAQILKIRDFF